MNLRKLLRSKAKYYPTLPFEMKILFAIVIYFTMLLIAIGDWVLLAYRFFKRLFHKLSLGFSSRVQKFSHRESLRLDFRPIATFASAALRKLHSAKTHAFIKKPRKKKKNVQKKQLLYVAPVRFWQKALYFSFGAVFSFIFFFLPLAFLIFVQSLPSPYELTIREVPQTTKILDRNGVLLTQIYAAQNRTVVQLDDIPQTLQHATLAIEDKNFYTHPGFDLVSIVRALKENVTGGTFQGGSTITQQLIKSAMLTPEPSIMRKTKEIVLAFWAERIYSKEQILQMYFNQIPYGGTAWGIEAASEVYFGKPVKELNLAESAFLAGITAAPSTYSPYGNHPTAWKTRQKEVLSRMVSLSYITKEQATEADKEKLQFKSQEIPDYAPHFVNYVKEFLIKKYGLATVEKGGLTVVTSIDVQTQQMAQNIVREEVEKASPLNVSNGASVVMNPQNGDILAMVGSKDFSQPDYGKVNLATSFRQPGSSIKVVTYSAALTKGLTAASIIDDRPTAFPIPGQAPYTPVNYDGHYFGRIPLRFALANSLNIPAVKVLEQVGIPSMVNLAKDMGVSSWGDPKNYGLSVTLGGSEVTMLDMTTVFATLANQGEKVEINPILKITDSSGKIYEQKTTVTKQRVLPSEVAFIIGDILADAQTRAYAFGPNSPLQIPGHTVSVKTGTSDSKRDNWAIGYTNNFVVSVWVGNNDNSPMSQSLASGITGAAPIWHRIMQTLLTKQPETRFSVPTNVTQKPCRGRIEYFVKGTENLATCGGNQPQERNNTYTFLPTR